MIKYIWFLFERLLQRLPLFGRYILFFCLGILFLYFIVLYLTWGKMGLSDQGDLLGMLRVLSIPSGVLSIVIAQDKGWLK